MNTWNPLGGLWARRAFDAIAERRRRATWDDARERARAVEGWGALGPAAAPLLVGLIVEGDHEEGIRIDAAKAMGHIGAEAVPLLIAELQSDPLRPNNRFVFLALGEIGVSAAAAIPVLLEILTGTDQPPVSDEVREQMIGTLERFGDVSLGVLIKLLAHPNWRARWDAVRAIGTLALTGTAASAALPALHQLLETCLLGSRPAPQRWRDLTSAEERDLEADPDQEWRSSLRQAIIHTVSAILSSLARAPEQAPQFLPILQSLRWDFPDVAEVASLQRQQETILVEHGAS